MPIEQTPPTSQSIFETPTAETIVAKKSIALWRLLIVLCVILPQPVNNWIVLFFLQLYRDARPAAWSIHWTWNGILLLLLPFVLAALFLIFRRQRFSWILLAIYTGYYLVTCLASTIDELNTRRLSFFHLFSPFFFVLSGIVVYLLMRPALRHHYHISLKLAVGILLGAILCTVAFILFNLMS